MLKTKNSEYQNLRGNLVNYEAEARKVSHLQATCEELNVIYFFISIESYYGISW